MTPDIHRLYDDLARYWPLISPPAHYAEEAAQWQQLIADGLGLREGDPRPAALELGTGGGHMLSRLRPSLGEVVASDLSDTMLAHSRRLNPDVTHVVGDMRSLRLNRAFDVVLGHDAISYMVTPADAQAAIATAAAHLRPGGVVLFGPDYVDDNFEDASVETSQHWVDDTHVVWIEYHCRPDPAASRVDTYVTMMLRRDGSVQVEHDRHIWGVHATADWLGWFAEAGIRARAVRGVEWPEGGHTTLLVGVKEG